MGCGGGWVWRDVPCSAPHIRGHQRLAYKVVEPDFTLTFSWRARGRRRDLAAQCCAVQQTRALRSPRRSDDGPRNGSNSSPPRRDGRAAAPQGLHMTLTNSTRRLVPRQAPPGSSDGAAGTRARSSRRRSSRPPCARAPSPGPALAARAARQRRRREEAAAAARRAHRQRAGRRARARAPPSSPRRRRRQGVATRQLVAAQPGPQTTERGGEGRLWAAYGSDEASAAGRRTLLSAQIDELDGDRVSSEADGLACRRSTTRRRPTWAMRRWRRTSAASTPSSKRSRSGSRSAASFSAPSRKAASQRTSRPTTSRAEAVADAEEHDEETAAELPGGRPGR